MEDHSPTPEPGGWKHSLLRHRAFPYSKELSETVRSLSPFEFLVFAIIAAIFAGSALVLLARVNDLTLIEVPSGGGKLTEGIVGSPRFINPLLSISDADRDLSLLVYSGLLRATPEGALIPDLAKSYTVSEDGLVYTFIIRDDALFHDGRPVTADDVLFTITQALDPALKSPKRANWDGVRVEKTSTREIRFTLGQPYTPFLENATLGILPKHVWEESHIEEIPFSRYNTDPIGSGPFAVTGITRTNAGIPESYELSAFRRFALGKPHLSKLIIRFYPNEETLIEAFEKGEVESVNGIAPERAVELSEERARIETGTLPRIFAVFFNQNQAALLAESTVREALDLALDKQSIVESVLAGYGTVIESPIPKGLIPEREMEASDVEEDPKAAARALLESDGWEFNEETGVLEKDGAPLSFSLATASAPELVAAAEGIEREWESIGAQIDVQIFEPNDLNQTVIRPRRYDALLFGQIIGRGLDLFAFWHSSQRNDPGLNVALYANITADDLLEKARTTQDKREQTDALRDFETEVANDTPAVFLYAPDFIYILPDRIKGFSPGTITTPSERFLAVHKWHTETEKVWPFFVSP